MQKDADPARTRPGSRSSTASRSSIKKSPKPTSCHSTPKRAPPKPDKPEFMVTGRKLLRYSDRASSLPGCRRPSPADSGGRDRGELSERAGIINVTAEDDDLSLDLTQADTSPPYTPMPSIRAGQPRRASLQSRPRTLGSSRISSGGDSVVSSATSTYRFCRSGDGWSSASPESCASSDASPHPSDVAVVSPFSRSLRSGASHVSGSDEATLLDARADGRGEWGRFWESYSAAPVRCYYDQCPTPYRTETVEMADLDYSAQGARLRSPENVNNINKVIRNDGLQLTPRETQNLIRCAHILGNVLSKAINRGTLATEKEEATVDLNKETDEDRELKKKMLSLDLREQNKPSKVEAEKKTNLTATTQTDISLPNTKSAPRIFEKILRQLSKSSIDEGGEKVKKTEDKPGKSQEEELEENKILK